MGLGNDSYERRHGNPLTPLFFLVGGTGMLGRAFAAEFRARHMDFVAPVRAELDLAAPDSIERLVADERRPDRPRVIINCAAWTDVDGAETNEAAALRVNGDGVRALGVLAKIWNAPLVHFSTDYVFAGDGRVPYTVGAERRPLNAYGRTKAAGEVALEESALAQWLNIRTSWVYAPWGRNFVRTMRRLLAEKPVVRVVNDQRGRPTSAEHLARAALELLRVGARGTYHVTDGGECTWYELASEIAMVCGSAGMVEPCTSAEFPRPARRPEYSVLDISETERLLGPMPPWRNNLADVLSRVEP